MAKRPFLIAKVGNTLPHISAKHGDFEKWFTELCGLDPSDVLVVSAHEGESLPEHAAVRAVLVTGSAAMVTARAQWSERAGEWIKAALGQMPVLGVCYGHQLIADALGGEVATNPHGREIGSIEVELTEAARQDPLFGVLPQRAIVQSTHLEAVTRLPPGAELMATSVLDPCQAYRLGEQAWCVQFHPEMSAEIIVGYIEARADAIAAEGLDPEVLAKNARDSAHGARLLKRFGELSG